MYFVCSKLVLIWNNINVYFLWRPWQGKSISLITYNLIILCSHFHSLDVHKKLKLQENNINASIALVTVKEIYFVPR